MRRWPILILAVSAALDLPPAAAQDARPDPPRTYAYREVGGETLCVYVFLPPDHGVGHPSNGILLFHGGGWVAGSPEWTIEAARRFASHGLVAISVQYRLSEGGVTPIEALEDVCAACLGFLPVP